MAPGEQLGLLEDLDVVEAVLGRVSSTLGMLIDRELVVRDVRCERAAQRPAGEGGVHVSFRMGFEFGGEVHHGALLVPLPEALALAAYTLCMSDEAVEALRSSPEPDAPTKGALLEVGGVLGGALGDAVRGLTKGECTASFAGCQGVRAGVRPALRYTEGDPLVVGRATARVHAFPEFELLLILPALPGML
jgi:hypothetical protein